MENAMKLMISMLVACCCLAAPQKKQAPAPATVPAAAEQVEPGLYRWTDPQGKVWLYRRTPFGVQRFEEQGEDARQKVIIQQTSAREEGDSVRFERNTPFGKRTWVRKKTELDPTEQKIWARAQDKTAASRAAGKE
jgi:hypothetical protein